MPEYIVKLQYMWINYCLCIWDWAVVAASQTEYSRCLSSCDISKPTGIHKVYSKARVYSTHSWIGPENQYNSHITVDAAQNHLSFLSLLNKTLSYLKFLVSGIISPQPGGKQATIFPEQTNGCCTPKCTLKVTELCHLQKVDMEFWG